jgi:hypothetical protein
MGTRAPGIRQGLQGTTPSSNRLRRRRTRFALAASLAVFSLAASASPAGASVTLGQLAPGVSPPGYLDGLCGGPVPGDYLQHTVISGNSYVVPGPGVITSWSHNAGDGSGMTLTFKVFRKFGGALFTAVGHSGPFPLLPSTVNTFPANIAVTTGDIIGLRVPTATPGVACDFEAPAEVGELTTEPDLADGQSGTFAPSSSSPFFGYRVNITAVFEPGNTVTVRKTTLNKKKGTATLTVNVPNPGELTGSGKGVKVAKAALISKTVTAPGAVKLTIRAKGKKKTTLSETGKVKVKPKITYTPTGGDPRTQSIKVKLRKKL